jgi:hypothetical protein
MADVQTKVTEFPAPLIGKLEDSLSYFAGH